MNSTFFTALNVLGTTCLSAATILVTNGSYLPAGVIGFLGVLCFLVYELVPEKQV
jgi:hypothetical protein